MNQYEITLELVRLVAQEGAFKSSNKDELARDIAKAFNEIKAAIFKDDEHSKNTPKTDA